jgi:hypothetical protein
MSIPMPWQAARAHTRFETLCKPSSGDEISRPLRRKVVPPAWKSAFVALNSALPSMLTVITRACVEARSKSA